MSLERTCAHAGCNNTFVPSRKDNIYCSSKCKFEAFKERKTVEPKPLGNLPKPVTQRTASDLRPPVPLDISAQFVIDKLKEDNSELKATVKEQAEEIKTLSKEKSELEKQVETVTRQLDEKPKGLSGIISSKPELLTDFIRDIPTYIGGLAELIKAAKQPQGQIAGAGNDAQQTPLMQWLNQQSPEFQQDFVQMVETLASLEPQVAHQVVQYTNRNASFHK
jgi:hypothetical protein